MFDCVVIVYKSKGVGEHFSVLRVVIVKTFHEFRSLKSTVIVAKTLIFHSKDPSRFFLPVTLLERCLP